MGLRLWIIKDGPFDVAFAPTDAVRPGEDRVSFPSLFGYRQQGVFSERWRLKTNVMLPARSYPC